ncbi:hypothetical protein [Bacillus inaquosorum]
MIPSEWTKIILFAEIFEIYQKFIFL